MSPLPRIAVIGAGVAGLAAAVDLARQGFAVTVLERAAGPGGKLRQVRVDGSDFDAGPTVFTLRRVFDELFDDAGDSLDRRLTLVPAKVLARHAWSATEQLDLFADVRRSADAVGEFAGARDARGFIAFTAQARRIYDTLDRSFMQASRPSLLELVRRVGVGRAADLWNIQPFTTLWRSAGRYFRDPRLRQLFARYATYCGSSPFSAPATLMLVAHAEQEGVWYLDGGMYQLALQLAALAARQGATLRYGMEIVQIHSAQGRISALQTEHGERIPVDAVVCNADTNALASGLFGDAMRGAVRGTPASARSLSAVTWNLNASAEGFELAHHSVFFSADYRAEFDDIFARRRLPRAPTVYICAQDRQDGEPFGKPFGEPLGKPVGKPFGEPVGEPRARRERLLCLVNAPPIGDSHSFEAAEIDACETQMFESLADFGLILKRGESLSTSPSQFNRMFPGTGGALYGPASHGWMASFRRPGSRSAIPGLYLAGGSSHPGPGVPMAAMSGRLAAASILADYASIARSRTMAMPGGTSMP